ncbi:MAG: methylmalonyl Co-A mutase-associated GTPase MeaB, partial [Nitrospinales bacterium]
GSLGGLSKKTEDVADIFDAFGKDIVILETVGVGQSELEIAQAADTTVVVLVPESGDSIQAMKAGLMEIADLFVVNKADREGADHAVMEIQSMLQLGCKEKQPVVLQAIASQGGGVDEIIAEIQKHRDFLSDNLLLEKKRKARILKKVKSIVRLRFEKAFWDEKTYEMINQYLENIGDSKLSPHKIADGLIDSFKKKLENTNDA